MPTVSMPSDKRQTSVDVTVSKTLTLADAGIVQNVRNSAAIVTLPATAAGWTFKFRVGGGLVTSGPQGVSTTNTIVTVKPAATDAVAGLGLTAVINKGLIYTNGVVGEEFTVTGTGTAGVAAWLVAEAVASNGVFSKEA